MEHSTTAEDTGRTLLMHSPVQLGTGWRKKRRHLFLFSDLLLISNTKYVYTHTHTHSLIPWGCIFTSPHLKKKFLP